MKIYFMFDLWAKMDEVIDHTDRRHLEIQLITIDLYASLYVLQIEM